MDLREYLFRKDLKVSQFAKEIGYHAVHIRAVVKGRTNPGRHLKTVIELKTKGEVKAAEWPSFKSTKKNIGPEKSETHAAKTD